MTAELEGLLPQLEDAAREAGEAILRIARRGFDVDFNKSKRL